MSTKDYSSNMSVENELPSYFALKSVPKMLIKDNQMITQLKAERDILNTVDFPFIMSNSNIGKDCKYIHFLGEFIDGICFEDVLMYLEVLTDKQTLFYVSQIIFMLEYLHTNNIIYRDLKPQNLICNTNGYIKLVDLGASKFLKKGDRTFTVIGTPHYTAPEVIKQDGYGYEADYWSLGVVLFEIIMGYLPFGGNSVDVFEVYKEI